MMDVVVKFANTNGTGSARANGFFAKILFRMGVPIVAKNLFPSNIQGFPTWYVVRASEKLSYTSRVDLMVAMNPQTFKQDLAELKPGGYFLYDNTWPLEGVTYRDDVNYLSIPLAKLCVEAFSDIKLRILMRNMVYLGALVGFFDLDLEIVDQILKENFQQGSDLYIKNKMGLDLGINFSKKEWAPSQLDPLKKRELDPHKIFIDGNSAIALGSLFAGATVASWYPITPSTSIMESFESFCKEYLKDPQTKKNNYCIIQTEDELSAIGSAIGANWAGARAFTCTSGPGISLMNEFLGLAYYAEIPVVLFDVERVGPSTGLPTRTQQSDLLLCAFASHGDTKHILLFPSDPHECFRLSAEAFDLADRFQTPVIVLSDLDIGMNEWVVDEFQLPPKPRRGKLLIKEEVEKRSSFYRYLDVDGDGIPYRTYPGDSPKGVYFTRGSGHNKFGAYTEKADEYTEVMERLVKKLDRAKELLPKPVIKNDLHCTDCVVAFGSSDGPVKEALDELKKEGKILNYLRLRSYPFSQEVMDFLNRHSRIFVVEQNRDGQMRSLITMEKDFKKNHLESICYYGGLPLSGEWVKNQLRERL